MIALAQGFPACTKDKILQRDRTMTQKTIQEVLKDHTPELMSIPGVVGTALGEHQGELCIKVLVIEKTPELTEKIPSTLEGFPVIIQQTGEIRALEPDN
jgi:hypothetical protein